VKLLEAFRDFEVWRRSKGRRIVITPATEIKVTYDDILKAVEELNERYPQHKYFAKKRRVKGKEFVVFGRDVRGAKGVPIYIDVEEGKIFVPISYIKRNFDRVRAVIDFRLTALGIPTKRRVVSYGMWGDDEKYDEGKESLQRA